MQELSFRPNSSHGSLAGRPELKLSHIARRVGWAAAAILISVIFAAPLLTLVLGSLRLPGLPPPSRGLELVPDPATVQGYRDALELAPLARAIANSLLVAAIFVPIAGLTASLAGFAIAHGSRRLRRRLIAMMLVLLVLPVTSLWIARFAIFEALGLVGSYVPLIAPALMGGSPFAVLLYAYAFHRIPSDVFDAARLEGAGPLQIWRRIAMPLVKGSTAAVTMLQFVHSWSNFTDPLLYLNTESTFTAPLALRYLEQLGPTNWPVLLAAAVMVAAPAAFFFVLVQRWFLGRNSGLGWLRG